jgi:hypothetical protein
MHRLLIAALLSLFATAAEAGPVCQSMQACIDSERGYCRYAVLRDGSRCWSHDRKFLASVKKSGKRVTEARVKPNMKKEPSSKSEPPPSREPLTRSEPSNRREPASASEPHQQTETSPMSEPSSTREPQDLREPNHPKESVAVSEPKSTIEPLFVSAALSYLLSAKSEPQPPKEPNLWSEPRYMKETNVTSEPSQARESKELSGPYQTKETKIESGPIRAREPRRESAANTGSPWWSNLDIVLLGVFTFAVSFIGAQGVMMFVGRMTTLPPPPIDLANSPYRLVPGAAPGDIHSPELPAWMRMRAPTPNFHRWRGFDGRPAADLLVPAHRRHQRHA